MRFQLVRPKRRQWVLLLLLIMHTLLLGYNARWMSPTLDEPAHVVAGISHWRFGDFALYRVNPPLIRSVAVLPVMLSGTQFEFPDMATVQSGRPEFRLGEAWVAENGRQTLWLTTLARWACIPFSWLGAIVCYYWARDLYGSRAGMLACSLWCFSPMVLGHAALLTPDAHAASLGLLACYAFWRWLKTPTWQLALSTGLVLGLAELAKTTLILLYPIWPLLWIGYRLSERGAMTGRRWWNEAAMLAFRMLLGLYVVNLGYLGTGSFLQLNQYRFVSEMFSGEANGVGADHRGSAHNRFADSWLGNLPVPLPYDYVMGIDYQQRDFENFGRPSYLRGVFQEQGWWYYYAYAALVKTPLGTGALLLLAIGMRLSRRWRGAAWRDELILLAPAAIIFAVVSSKTGFSHHYRYVFPCLPFVLIWISQVAVYLKLPPLPSRLSPHHKLKDEDQMDHNPTTSWLVSAVIAVCIASSIGSSLWHYPHSLAYFNEASGGPTRGPEHLLNSNIDWGQDLLHLERWIDGQAEQATVYLAFDNYLNPFDLEISQIAPWPLKSSPTRSPVPVVEPPVGQTPVGQTPVGGTPAGGMSAAEAASTAAVPPPAIPDGYYAVSINQLYEFPWPLRELDGSYYFIDKRPLQALRAMQPIGWGGYSIRVYSAAQVRRAYHSVLSQ